MNRNEMIRRYAVAQANRLRDVYGQPQQVNLSLYETDGDLRQLRPEDGEDATAADQRELTNQVARELEKHGFKVRFIKMRAVDYQRWLTETGKNNNPATRAEFISWKMN